MELIPQMDILTQKHLFLDISNGIGHCYRYFLLQSIVLSCHVEGYFAAGGMFCTVADSHFDFDAFVLDVRIDLHVIYIDWVYSYQLNFAQYSVPVYLGKFGVGMVPFMGIVLVAVVYAESYQFFFAWM